MDEDELNALAAERTFDRDILYAKAYGKENDSIPMTSNEKAFIKWTDDSSVILVGVAFISLYKAFRNRAVRDSTLYRPVTWIASACAVSLWSNKL